MTDLDAPRYKIIEIDLTNPSSRPLEGDRSRIQRSIGGCCVGWWQAGRQISGGRQKPALRFRSGRETRESEIALPAIGTVGTLSGTRDRPELFYMFTSFLYPSTIYRYDVSTGQNKCSKNRTSISTQTSTRQSRSSMHRRMARRSRCSLYAKKGIKLDGNNPVFLTGYGGFNISITPSFSASYASWIEKGGVFALPNLRGGGEYGREWHEAGMKEHKQNVFDDFIAAAEDSDREKYTKCRKDCDRGRLKRRLAGRCRAYPAP